MTLNKIVRVISLEDVHEKLQNHHRMSHLWEFRDIPADKRPVVSGGKWR